MANETENKSESILPMISRTSDPKQTAIELFKNSKSSSDMSLMVTDHETYPTIYRLQHEFGRQPIVMALVLFIEDCVRSLNIKEPSKEQVMELAGELINDNPSFKLEDFRVFFTNIKKGKYGSDYNRFDISTVYRMMAEYQQERAIIFEQAIQQRKSEMNASQGIRSGEVDMVKVYQQVINKSAEEIARKRYDKLRKEAISKWMYEYQMHFQGKNPIEATHEKYLETHPLDEKYIEEYIKSCE